MARPVDEAMAAERPEKETIRSIWVEQVRHHDGSGADDVPLYLTLPGASGRDIAALIDDDLLSLTEMGSIEDPEEMRVVAVEQSPQAAIELQERYPGLKILIQPLHALLRSVGDLKYPEGIDKKFCRAQVVNLDFDKPLQGEVKQGQLIFPALALVAKLARLHADDPHVNWTLCLTLNAGLDHWSKQVDSLACQFLASNFEADSEFSALALDLLGPEFHSAIADDPSRVTVRKRPIEDQQRFLMALVPKRIARDVHASGWKVETLENLRYGVDGEASAMVTWVFRLSWDSRATTNPDLLYREAVRASLVGRGGIDEGGNVYRD